MDSAIIAAIIGAAATIVAAVIGFLGGRYRERKSRHSVEEFLDIYERLLRRAMKTPATAVDQKYAIARAIVDTVRTWRGIQDDLRQLLNGLVDQLDTLTSRRPVDSDEVRTTLVTLAQAFDGKKAAIRTTLRRRNI